MRNFDQFPGDPLQAELPQPDRLERMQQQIIPFAGRVCAHYLLQRPVQGGGVEVVAYDDHRKKLHYKNGKVTKAPNDIMQQPGVEVIRGFDQGGHYPASGYRVVEHVHMNYPPGRWDFGSEFKNGPEIGVRTIEV